MPSEKLTSPDARAAAHLYWCGHELACRTFHNRECSDAAFLAGSEHGRVEGLEWVLDLIAHRGWPLEIAQEVDTELARLRAGRT